jgi:hypothetical protein
MTPMLAHGEAHLLPIILGSLIFFPLAIALAIWSLVAGLNRDRNAFTISCAVLITVAAAMGLAGILKDFVRDILTGAAGWSDAPVISFLFLGCLFFSGAFALTRMRRGSKPEAPQEKHEE